MRRLVLLAVQQYIAHPCCGPDAFFPACRALFAVAEGITQTGALEAFFRKVLGRPKSSPGAQVRMMLPVGFWSAFLNNTPVVALMIPIVSSWSRAIKISPGQLMIPLSYVSELGGVCTLIGTSTNLVVKGMHQHCVQSSSHVDIVCYHTGSNALIQRNPGAL